MQILIKSRRPSFTLIEMTIVIAIIGILAAMAMSVYATALSQSKAHRTRTIIAKIDTIIGEKWEGYRTRQVPIRILPGTNTDVAAGTRLLAMRELQRFELPDRITDVTAGPAYGSPPNSIPQTNYPVYALSALFTRPAINKLYLRRAFQAHAPGSPGTTGLQYWTNANENAECLYLILAATRDGDKNALDYFSPSEIGDVDDDGMNEILDGWGQPIAFLRWAPGYRADIAPFPVTPQTAADADPFDPLKIDYRFRDVDLTNDPIALRPLIWSAGADKTHDIQVGVVDSSNNAIPYATTSPANDPYHPQPIMAGSPADGNADNSPDYTDNITNHDLEAR